jgi:myosin-18
LDAVRLHKNGFPESMTYGDFWRRYRILSDSDVVQIKSQPGVNEVRPVVEQLLQYLDLDKTAGRLGNTQVGFSSLFYLDVC